MKFSTSALLVATTLVGSMSTVNAFVMPQMQQRQMATTLNEKTATKDETDFDLSEYIMSKQPAITKALEDSVVSPEKETDLICESMRYSLMAGGKRVRPVLCLAACEMFGGTEEVSMPTAVALEMIHTMSLIHDDLPSMDDDDLRRGKPTNHVVYGEDIAILAGDALLSTSFQVVAQNTPADKVEPSRILDVVTRLGRSVGAKGLAGGQVMDLICEGKRGKRDVTIDDLRWIHTHKTAALLDVAVCSGAILGGATAEEVAACEKFAINIGLAFQVADDILDVTQSTEELGKTAAKDLEADKTTYPKLLGLDGARKEAERLVAEAKEALEPFGDRAIPLLALADYIINRKN
uniref:Geranylgeranyl pyrophosphate synthase n=1 Tax=Craspedostauros australis TaxID=1486917 RepID=A0A7R9WMP3_9STRA|mmetsp:Transcript_10471/g.28823  ORF Transcript_10471/g.28823 Transcript_10471/m.28823 type:complete len:350 (+) Transcript_10471:184-1233(+)|eukprot:CAMPEP_0198135728 /NCGR_PEP_ID=MMETSP1442-20131203/60740_1 /TAXON_ID= /ORGANISM="Craspedostauros australis, Strain CCMP3328" /LENGTH=349 /DNA_ID=CAMNT_0043796913 /DNA_START=142 /DNA_END=1191 /DNA_ORIENTATION=+